MYQLLTLLIIHIFFLSPVFASSQKLRLNVANTSYETGLVNALQEDFQSLHPDISIIVTHKGALQVLEDARQGKTDFVLTHFPSSEKIYVDDGLAYSRTLIMYNEFALIGPKDDYLELRQQTDMNTVLHMLADNAVDFLIPHSSSGTTNKINELFTIAGVSPDWEGIEGSGQSTKLTLFLVDKSSSFSFVDVGTFLVNKDKLSGNLAFLFRDNVSLRNYYHAIIPNPEKFPSSNLIAAKEFLAYLVSERGQLLISQFGEKNFSQHIYTAAAHLDPGLKVTRLKEKTQQRELQMNIIAGSIFLLIIAVTATIAIIYRFKLIRTELESMRHIESLNKELEINNQKLLKLSTTDFLTNVPNRRHFFEMGEKYISLAVRNNQPISLLVIDIDFFKKINDSYGHLVGDQILIHATSCITKLLRKSDLFGRIGGEEFAVLLSDSNTELAKSIAEKLRTKIENAAYCQNKIDVSFTISIGCTELNSEQNSLSLMYAEADKNLFLAKEQGRNCVVA